MSPKTREHDLAIAYLTRLFVDATPSDVSVLVQLARSLDDRWEPEPEPDLALVEPGAPSPYIRPRPGSSSRSR